MKRILSRISFILLMTINQAGWSETGDLFTVTGTGTLTTLDITLCLNGRGPLSCQDYTVTRQTLHINTVTPNHTYPAVGIKIKTPGYTMSGCRFFDNGYCLFSASNTTSATISITSTTNPISLTSINPTHGTPAGCTAFTLTGTNLTNTTGVTFGGIAATNIVVLDSTTVTGLTPAHPGGLVDVTVTDPQGSATLTNGYTYSTTLKQPSNGAVTMCLH